MCKGNWGKKIKKKLHEFIKLVEPNNQQNNNITVKFSSNKIKGQC